MVDVDRIRRIMEDESVDLPPISAIQALETVRLFELGARLAAERESRRK